MTRYLVLLRGINVGGRNKVSMAALRELLESLGHSKVSTYIASGNAILSSEAPATTMGVADPTALSSMMGRGMIARTLRELADADHFERAVRRWWGSAIGLRTPPLKASETTKWARRR